jgi:hypothetical protein
MRVSLKKAFSLIDGRLSTEIDDVYEMLNYIYSDNLHTHQLKGAIERLKELRPEWFEKAIEKLNWIKNKHNTNDFQELMRLIDQLYSDTEIKLSKIDEKIAFSNGLTKRRT